MAAPTLLLAVVVALVLAERAGELVLNRRNTRWLRERGAIFAGPDGFGLILAGQFLLFGGLVGEGLVAPWTTADAWTWPLLLGALAAQALRYWVITTLGHRWSIRVVTLPGAPRITTGPYRWMRHPNYLAVILEAILLPLAFHAYATLFVVLPLTLVALARRVRLEERALGAAASPNDHS